MKKQTKKETVVRLPIFVYGTLLKGHPNHDRMFKHLKKQPTVTSATLTGHTLLAPRGAYFPYLVNREVVPEMYAGTGSIPETVSGQLLHFDAKDFDDVLVSLDHLEGVPHHYHRKVVQVWPNTAADLKNPVDAYVYHLPDKDVSELFHNPIIGSGSWDEFEKSNNPYRRDRK